MADDDLTIRLRAIGARPFKRDVDRSARSLDNFGDQAGQAARKLAKLNAASTKTRVSIGPFSTTTRGAALAIGTLAIATGKAATGLLGLAEATATAAGGAGAAGGVGLTALAQGLGTAKLATAGLTDALGGNKDALAKLNPAQAKFVQKLQTMQPLLDKLRGSAAGGFLGGAGKGLTSASKNFGVLNKIVRSTSGTLGGLAQSAGRSLGSKKTGQDLASIGATNVKIIDNLGHATLNLALATGDVLVEAGPLANWLSEMARRGAALTQTWVANARATGQLSAFFKRARTDLALLGSITGHGATGLINLFGAQDVDGTKTLASLDRIAARFEAWSRSPAVQKGFGQAIIDQIPNAAGGIASALAKTLGAAAPMAANIFWKAFVNADAAGKVLIGGVLAKKLGLVGLASKAAMSAIGGKGKGGALGALAARGSTPANPLFVSMVGGGVPGVTPGGGKTGKTGTVGKLGRVAKGAGKFVLPIGIGVAAAEGLNAIRKPLKPGQVTRTTHPPAWGPDMQSHKPKVRSLPTGFGFDPIFHNVMVLDGRVVYEAYKKHDKSEKARH